MDKTMKILHLLSGGGIGGIEMLCCDIADLGQEQHEFCFLFSGGEIAEKMKKGKTPIYLLYQLSLLERIKKLFFLVKREQYDIVIVHHEGTGIYFFYLLLHCFKKIKFVKYLHCSFEKKFFYKGNVLKDGINYYFLKKAIKKSDGIVAVSEFVKQSYCHEFACSTDKVKVIYNGITTPEKVKRKYYAKKADDPVRLLYIGRLVEVKGVHLLLEAMKNLIDMGENVALDILGDGSMRARYEELSNILGIQEQVFFHGYRLDKQEFFNQADIFVYPSIWQEAFGISILEAYAQGVPCVASDVGGIPEIISDGKDGFLFQSENMEHMMTVLLKAVRCSRSLEYQKMAEAAKQKSCRFTIEDTINNLQKYCKNLVEEQ